MLFPNSVVIVCDSCLISPNASVLKSFVVKGPPHEDSPLFSSELSAVALDATVPPTNLYYSLYLYLYRSQRR